MKTLKYLSIVVIFVLIACSKQDGSSGIVGQGGSLAKFAIVDDRLFIADQTDIDLFDISAQKACLPKRLDLNRNIDALFARDSKVLFSANRSGLSIIDISNNNFYELDFYSHVVSCDPVVADDKYAYVTIFTDNETSTGCFRGENRLEILDISDLKDIKFVKSIDMVQPIGLAIINDHLFVCDNGKIKAFDLADREDPKLVAEYKDNKSLDVIALDDILLVRDSEGVTQLKFDYNSKTFQFLSQI